jgi:hypothetical protein
MNASATFLRLRRSRCSTDFASRGIERYRHATHYSSTIIGYAATDSSDQTTPSKERAALELWEFPSSDGSDYRNRGVLYAESPGSKNTWEKNETSSAGEAGLSLPGSTEGNQKIERYTKEVLGFFLPAKYPESVAQGYSQFAGFCFTASIAGSAAMVLSTQTLLLAVGVVGSNVQQAGIMAGAFNWVMKDFVGQLGGVIFASQMGKTRAFDADPKRWRMVAAMALDGATLIEILSPLFPAVLILPVASIANVGKNIGFLTASASRASLHQSVAITGNLGDVTAKSGSQSIMASLIGTSLGIGMSSFLEHDTYNFALGFCVLAVVHQGCNYLSLQSVALTYFNRQRLHIVLEQYILDGTIMTPAQVALKESYFPLVAGDSTTSKWLSMGATSLGAICPNPADLREALDLSTRSKKSENASYIVRAMPDDHVHLMFFQESTGEDMIRGMYHACLLHEHLQGGKEEENHGEFQKQFQTKIDSGFGGLLKEIQAQGWKIDTEVTTLEDSHARRLVWKE